MCFLLVFWPEDDTLTISSFNDQPVPKPLNGRSGSIVSVQEFSEVDDVTHPLLGRAQKGPGR
jgi:hypothetical protein